MQLWAGNLTACDSAQAFTFCHGSFLIMTSYFCILGAVNLIAAVVAFFLLPKPRYKWIKQATLVADNEIAALEFGRAVAIKGNTVVVAAPYEYLPNDVCQGTVHVYVRSGDCWCLQAKLFVPPHHTGSYSFFGSSVAIDGDTVLIAADSLNTTDSSTPLFVFTRTGENWSMQEKIRLPFVPQVPIFYQSVALAGDTAVAGTKGKVYIFRRLEATGNWCYEALLESPKKDNCFGDTVAIANNTIIVSGGDKGCASAYIFVHDPATGDWLEQAQLTTHQSNGSSNTVAISGNTAIIGTPEENLQQGAAYVFQANPSTGEWLQQTRLVPGDIPPFFALGFGGSVAIDGNTIVVGTSTKTFTKFLAFNWNNGGAYVFDRSVKGGWLYSTKLLPQNYSPTQNYGQVVSISGDKIIVAAGEPEDAAYIFKRVNSIQAT